MGNLPLSLQHGEVLLNKPAIYQLDENVAVGAKSKADMSSTETKGSSSLTDAAKQLIIDPVLATQPCWDPAATTLLLNCSRFPRKRIHHWYCRRSEFSNQLVGAFKTQANSGGAFVTKLDPNEVH